MNWKIWLGALLLFTALLSSLENYINQEPQGEDGQGAELVVQSFSQQKSGIWLEFNGSVEKILKDDRHGSRHQRFIVKLKNQHTVLITHNIDLAPRIPLGQEKHVQIKGRYEWNPKGGVVHWTHHDPKGDITGGWVLYDGVKYD